MKPSNPTLRPWLLALSAAAIFSAAVHAATYDFTGALNGAWNNEANWVGGVTPTFNNEADLKFGVNIDMARDRSFLGSNNRTVRSLEFGNTSTPVEINLGSSGTNTDTPRVLTFDADSGNATIKVNSNVSADVTIGILAVGSITLADNLAVTNESTSATLIINRVISETGGAKGLIKDGVGILQIGGTNTFTGTTTVNGGVLRINADARLGSAPGSYVADQLTLNGGTLRTFAGFTMNANRGITLGASGGSIDVTFTNPTGGNLTIDGIITGSGSLTTSTDTDTRALNLGGANDYSGSTTINSGILRLMAGGSISSSSNLTINGSSNFNVRNTNNWVYTGTITGDGTGVINLNTDTNATLAGNISGVANIYANHAGTNATISGDISGTANVIVQNEGGILTLSGTNTYSGVTTVANTGTLIVNGDNSGANGNVTVNAGGTLKGSGIIGANVTIAGTLAAGNGIGEQTFGNNLTYSSGSIFAWELSANESGRGINYDAVNVGGSLAGSGGVFRAVLTEGSFADGFWTTDRAWSDIFMNAAKDASLSFASLFSSIEYWEGNTNVTSSIGSYGGFTISGSSLEWQAVPEPSTSLAGLLLGAGLLRRRR